MAEGVEEVTRNALLRRVDWRLILGLGQRVRKTASHAQPDLTSAVGAISDELVELERAGEPCDLVVLTNPDEETLRRAYEALRPGGACYSESTRPLPGGASRIRRRLERAGFTDVACYWPWPRPARTSPRFWLPLQAPGPSRYFLRTRPRPAERGRVAAAIALRRLWRLAARAQLLAPTCALASRPPAAEGPSLPPLLRSRWEEWGLGAAPDRVTCLVETGGRRSVNKVVVLAFAGEEERPRIVVKLARVAESGPGLAREAAALRSLPEIAAPGVVIPELVFEELLGGTPAVGLTAVQGQPVSTLLDLDGYRDYASRVTAFLVQLASGGEQAPREDWWGRIGEPVVSRFEAAFGELVGYGELDTARSLVSRLPDLPVVFEQRDMSPWNVLVSPDGMLSVLDWESAEPRGLPGLDLLYFLAYGAFFVEGTMDSGGESATYARMLDPLSPTGEVVRDCVERYVRATGIGLEVLGPLRVLLWMLHADSEHERLVADAGGRATDADLLASVCLGLWREELRHAGQDGAGARL